MDVSHVPGLDLGGFLIPGNNGLPDLVVNATDPADWTTMQIAARNPVTDSNIPVAAEATAAAAETGLPPWLKAIEDVTIKRLGISFGDYLRGFAVAGVGVLLALILIIFAVYQLTKD